MESFLNKNIFDKIFRRLMLAFQFKPTTENEYNEMFALYFNTFSRHKLTDQQIINVGAKLIMNWKPEYGRKFPTVSDFLSLEGALPSQVAKKALKWLKKKKIKTGPYRPLEIKNNNDRKSLLIIQTVHELGGWINYCSLMYDEEKKFDIQFLETYERNYYDDKCIHDKHYLLGLSDMKNNELLKNEKLLTAGPTDNKHE